MIQQQNRKPTANQASGPRLDETDKAIIRHLQEDGRMAYSKLGPLVGLSAPAARQRVLQLIESGAMQVVAVTDPTQLGFDIQAMVGVRVTGDIDQAAEQAAFMPEVDYVVMTAGRFDLLIELVCEGNEHLLEVVNEIRQVEAVSEVEVFSYLRLVKQSYDWGTR